MPTDGVTRAFREWGKVNGFRRAGTTMYRDQGETVAVVNLQGSQWGGAYYINVGWWLSAIAQPNDPPHNRCHIRSRLGAFVPNAAALTQVLRDDSGLTDTDREQRLREMLDDYLTPHLAATQTLAQIKSNEGDWLDRVGVTGPALEVLGVV